MAKATHEQIKRHNRQLILRAIFAGEANTRAALSHATGLAKPTVSELTAEWIARGVVGETGLGNSTEVGGKRPMLLRFVPDVQQVIGVAVERAACIGRLCDLAGRVIVEHHLDGTGDPQARIMAVIDALRAQLDAPLLCVGIGVPGTVDREAGIVRRSYLDTLTQQPLGSVLYRHYGVPVYLASSMELAALAQFAFQPHSGVRHAATILITDTVEIGVAVAHGAYHNGSDIGQLNLLGMSSQPVRLTEWLRWDVIREHALMVIRDYPSAYLHPATLSYLTIGHAAANGDPAALAIIDHIATALAVVFAWVIALVTPDQIVLAGAITDIGHPLMSALRPRVAGLLTPEWANTVTLKLADPQVHLAVSGAVAMALRRELGIV